MEPTNEELKKEIEKHNDYLKSHYNDKNIECNCYDCGENKKRLKYRQEALDEVDKQMRSFVEQDIKSLISCWEDLEPDDTEDRGTAESWRLMGLTDLKDLQISFDKRLKQLKELRK